MAKKDTAEQSFSMEILHDINDARRKAVILNYILSVCLLIALIVIIIK